MFQLSSSIESSKVTRHDLLHWDEDPHIQDKSPILGIKTPFGIVLSTAAPKNANRFNNKIVCIKIIGVDNLDMSRLSRAWVSTSVLASFSLGYGLSVCLNCLVCSNERR